MIRNTYEVNRFDRQHRNTIHSITTYVDLPPDFMQKAADDSLIGVRFAFYDRDTDTKRPVSIFSDGRERDGKRARERFSERYCEGWINLLEYHKELIAETGLQMPLNDR
ncbi:MAG: hypothetical protein JJU28_09285 [Cyclobacteriaceae bacterium]|nr:hypothetical protein [Cyclobacteriaceae bacterium]